MKLGQRLFPIFLLLLSLAAGGCAHGNVVSLSYPEALTAVRPKEKSGTPERFAVVAFENARLTSDIGKRRNGEIIRARTPVEPWLAQALAAELAKSGYTAIPVDTMEEALAATPDYIITGDLDEFWLEQMGVTRYASTIRTTLCLHDGKENVITANSYNGVFSRTVIPGMGVPQTLLPQALQELLRPAVRLIVQTVDNRRTN